MQRRLRRGPGQAPQVGQRRPGLGRAVGPPGDGHAATITRTAVSLHAGPRSCVERPARRGLRRSPTFVPTDSALRRWAALRSPLRAPVRRGCLPASGRGAESGRGPSPTLTSTRSSTRAEVGDRGTRPGGNPNGDGCVQKPQGSGRSGSKLEVQAALRRVLDLARSAGERFCRWSTGGCPRFAGALRWACKGRGLGCCGDRGCACRLRSGRRWRPSLSRCGSGGGLGWLGVGSGGST